jgi:hypothetical protein
MIDMEILAESGVTRERLREFFTAEMPSEKILAKVAEDSGDATRKKLERRIKKDIDKREQFENMILSWINEQVVFNLTNNAHFGSLQMAWDSVPINKQIVPLMMYAQGRINFEKCEKSLQTLPGSERFIKAKEGKKYIDLPKFFDMNINLVRSVITRRKAAQCNKYNNLWPFFKYEARSTALVGKLRAELVSQRMDIMADQYGYRHTQEQIVRDMLLYPFSVSFPRASWEREVQWAKAPVAPEFAEKGKISKIARVVKEGVSWVTPDPSRVIYDNQYPLASINEDNGCEWVGYWDVMRWKDISNDPSFFNRKLVTYDRTMEIFQKFTAFFDQFQDRIVPPVAKQDVPAENDRKANVGIYTSEMGDTSTFFTELFVKMIPRKWGIGKYPYPIWLQLKVAGDKTVVFADIMPSGPGAYFGWNQHDGRLLNISMGHELMQFQDQLTNLYTQLLESIKRDLWTVAVLNTDVFPNTDDGQKALKAFQEVMSSEKWYSDPAILSVSFEKLKDLGIQLTADNIFKVVRSAPNNQITSIFNAIVSVINMADRLQSMTSQEQGQASPSGISATESSFLANAKENMEEDISNAIDQGRSAQKRICYESWQACGEDVVTLPVINRFQESVIIKAGLKPVEEDIDDLGGQLVFNSVTGSKLRLIHDYIFTSRDGTDRANSTQSAEAIVKILTAITNAPQPVVSAVLKKMGAGKYFELINEAARLASGIDLKLDIKPGESDDLMIEDEQQVMALIQRLTMITEKNAKDINDIKETLHMPTAGDAPGSAPPPPPEPPQVSLPTQG